MPELHIQTKKTLFIVITILIAVSIVFVAMRFSGTSPVPFPEFKDAKVERSTSEPGIEQGEGDFSALVYEEYLLKDANGDPIDISGEDVSATIMYPGGREGNFRPLHARTHMDLSDDSTEAARGRSVFLMSIWPPLSEGDHVIRIREEGSEGYQANFYWPGTTELSADLQEQTDESSGFLVGEEGVAEFQRMLHIYPSGSTEELSPREENILWLSNDLEEGDHVFLIKQNNTWYYAVINNPEDF